MATDKKNMGGAVLQLQINNNTNSFIDYTFMGAPVANVDMANQYKSWTFDMTGVTYAGNTNIIISYKLNAATNYSSLAIPFTGSSLQDVVNAINNYGPFTFYSSGNNLITYNDNYTFQSITLTNVLNPSPSTLSCNISSVGAGGSNTIILQNGTQIFNQANPIASTFPTFGINGGDTISVSGQIPASAVIPIQVSVTDTTLGVVLYAPALVAGNSFAYSFTVTAGHNYSFFAVSS